MKNLTGVKGVRATIQNTIKYLPDNNLDGFESAIREIESSGKETTGDYQLDDIVSHREEIRSLVSRIRRLQPSLTRNIVQTLLRYAPEVRGLTITVYFVAGGVSDGFLLDNDPEPEFFVALGKGDQDVPGLKLDITHEAFHAVQRKIGRDSTAMRGCVANPNGGPVLQRLLCSTLLEGTASYVADPTKASEAGPYIGMWRGRYIRNLKPAQLKRDFEEFERDLVLLHGGSLAWRDAYSQLFTPPDTPAYFVGYEMARVIARHDGSPAIGALFRTSPRAFFTKYIALSRAPNVAHRFSPAVERIIEQLPNNL